MKTEAFPTEITVQPWFADHCFNGTAVFPAVETMLVLALGVMGRHQDIDVRVMEDARFSKFLEIPAERKTLAVMVEEEYPAAGSVRSRLLSRIQFRAMSRLKVHGEILFPAHIGDVVDTDRIPFLPEDSGKQVRAHDLYRELVPFGPAYHTLKGSLSVAGEYARGKLVAPEFPLAEEIGNAVGSPFPLDGSFHAACVLGQRFADFVPFPVGFSRRVIHRASQPGQTCFTTVRLTERTPDELLFDLDIVDEQDRLCETVRGLRMRDVSGGRIKPPAWIKES